MSITEQYAMDIWRLRGQGVPEPPAPGAHEARILWAWWTARKEARKEAREEAREEARNAAREEAGKETGRGPRQAGG
ncbi:hypothetical protein [Streptomyces axinellae]|uniref:Uncharacterized protein n=1 Tax=Streptomyces axinellae TaxID=552788 RepID=A0ABP6C7Z2_9ACTN